jgi:hypothetical protein
MSIKAILLEPLERVCKENSSSPSDLDPPKSPFKRGTLTEFSPLFKGGWGGSPGLETHPSGDRPKIQLKVEYQFVMIASNKQLILSFPMNSNNEFTSRLGNYSCKTLQSLK